jgi:hypothetical protein
LTRLLPRLAAFATAATAVGGLVAAPAYAVNNYVTQPVVTGVSSLTPESAVLSGAIDTGGDQGVTFTGTTTSPYAFGGPGVSPITTTAILNGIPVGEGFYSTALFEADPEKDYVASGNQPGADTVIAQVVEVPTATGETAVSAEIGAYPAGNGFGSSPLTPGTKYIYWIVQQAGETGQATTVNEYSPTDLANWIAGSGTITANGFASSSTVTSSNDYAAWAAGTGSFAGDPKDPSKVPGSLINPDYSCVLNSTIAANTNSTWAAEKAAGEVPTAAGASTINGTPVPYGIASASVSGAFTAASGQKPAEQGPCVTFYGGGANNFYQSGFGSFTTPKLGKIVVAGKGTVSGHKATLTISADSVEKGAGTIVLTAKKGKKTVTVASGHFSVPAGATSLVSVKLTSAGKKLFKKTGKIVAKVKVTSTTDQPSRGKKVTLT